MFFLIWAVIGAVILGFLCEYFPNNTKDCNIIFYITMILLGPLAWLTLLCFIFLHFCCFIHQKITYKIDLENLFHKKQ